MNSVHTVHLRLDELDEAKPGEDVTEVILMSSRKSALVLEWLFLPSLYLPQGQGTQVLSKALEVK